jgi:PleD family two-component response regulator
MGEGALSALVVDDEAHVRAYLRVILNLLGVTKICEACDGEEAVRVFQENRPSVVSARRQYAARCPERKR